jgi:N6-L-threonylcarbamoyladenine synthase
MLDRPGLEFSFSGLKTAVLHAVRAFPAQPSEEQLQRARADVAREVQEAIVDTLVAKTLRAIESTGLVDLVVAGGVGANRRLRARFDAESARRGLRVYYPRLEFCTDNAAMIAVAGLARLQAGERDGAGIAARARWPLESLQPLAVP